MTLILTNLYLKEMLKNYLPEHEIDKFALFAFGEDYKKESCRAITYLNLWNSLHGDKLKLSPTGLISDDVHKMIEVYRKSLIIKREYRCRDCIELKSACDKCSSPIWKEE